ncbi:fungal specific transcription [Diplodia corticola]|uniref:Fungal specific transcription n=1 Tax=Diplodia corticola TaxID=236234 RepID=A0A1J9QMH6_9PEZI|nr:fungal specific transcription [Diplodia corticola]OJD29688.1 fungal specific transcription [Diplodia corticola]
MDGKIRPARSRRHITTACWPCREDKIKCDGTTPECRQCAAKGRGCSYAGVDRRKLSLRKAVEAYSQRVSQLESYIRSQGLAVPPAPNQDHEATMSQLSSLYAPDPAPQLSPAQPAYSEAALNKQPRILPDLGPTLNAPAIQPSNSPPIDILSMPTPSLHAMLDPPEHPCEVPPMGIPADLDFAGTALPFNHCFDVDWVWNHTMAPQMDAAVNVDELDLWAPRGDDPAMRAEFASSSADDPSPPTLLNDDDSTDDEDHSAVTNQLSARLGSLLTGDNGERHFYGATSNLNLARSKTVAALYARRREKGRQAHARLEAAGVDQCISSDLEDHLLHLFFTWHNPSLYLVDRDIFRAARKRFEDGDRSTSFYSPFLLNAMCAVGAIFETRKHPGLPTPLAEFFASRATTLLDIELESPRIATVQALAILSSHEAACTRDTQGWLFGGMAVRLAIDFGLHTSAKPYVEAGTMSIEEARGRSVAFWGAFATDRMWGLYLGRPLHDISATVTMETPIAFSEHRETYWTPSASGLEHGVLDHQEILVEQYIQLPRIMSALEGALYFQADASKVELQKLAQKTWDRLLAWRRNLPRELDLDLDGAMPANCVPHVLILHMFYEYLVILLHRPFVAKRYIQPHPLVGSGPQHARQMCVRSASRIATLLSWYEERFSLGLINIQAVQMTFSAALVLVYATVSEGGDVQSHQLIAARLDTCCRALAELGNTFDNATRTLDVLLHVKRTWQARLVAASSAAGSKRRAQSFASDERAKRRSASHGVETGVSM